MLAGEDSLRPNQVLSVDAVPGMLYVQHRSWLQAVAVSDPQRPSEIAWTNFGGVELVDFDASDGLVYLATTYDGLLIAELRLPEPAATVFLPRVTAGRR